MEYTRAEIIEDEKARIDTSIEAALAARNILENGTPAWCGWDKLVDTLLLQKETVHLKYPIDRESEEIAEWLPIRSPIDQVMDEMFADWEAQKTELRGGL